MKVLFVSSEVVPFSKTGGLADVSGSLPTAISKLGCDVRVISPFYDIPSMKKFKFRKVPNIEIVISIGFDNPKKGHIMRPVLKDTNLEKSKVKFFFLRNKEYFARTGLYTDSDDKPYLDNDARFIFFSRGILEYIRQSGWIPDIIHCNDWHTGLISAYLKYWKYTNIPIFKSIATLYTIHNIAYQGKFGKLALYLAGFSGGLFYPTSPFEFYGKVNFMKAGLIYADLLNTVSEKYAEEIQTAEYGEKLEGVLEDRNNELYGILNGIDYSVWNPATDKIIPYNYTSEKLEGKLKNKIELLKQNGLPYKENVPIIGIISRLAAQKGFDLITEVADKILKLDLQIIILGTGAPEYHKLFKQLAKKYPKKIGVNLTFNNELAHLIEAGADMFLMPSRYEPCGLNQIYSLKYATIPIVRATGGLDDTIENYNDKMQSGNGFVFKKYDAREMLKVIKQAIEVYQNKENWTMLMKRAMNYDFSWDISAQKYIKLYQLAISKRHN